MARLQRISGLRISEAVHLQTVCIALDGSKIELIGRGVHTKGGRPRQVPILPQHQPWLVELRAESQADGHAVWHHQSPTAAVKRSTAQLVVNLGITAGHGTHSYRKLHANELFCYLCRERGIPLGRLVCW